MGQLIDCNETDIKDKPNLKKIYKDTLLYNDRIFKLYSGLTTESKAKYRWKYFSKDEKNYRQDNQNFVEAELFSFKRK